MHQFELMVSREQYLVTLKIQDVLDESIDQIYLYRQLFEKVSNKINMHKMMEFTQILNMTFDYVCSNFFDLV
jgi:hypothetical protein